MRNRCHASKKIGSIVLIETEGFDGGVFPNDLGALPRLHQGLKSRSTHLDQAHLEGR